MCLGNICRSPSAEAIHRERYPESATHIDSAGTGAWHIGKAPDSRMLVTLSKRGIDASSLRARQFTRGDFDRFDLIIVMDEQNRRDVERLRPKQSVTPVRCLLEFSDIFEGGVIDPYYEGDEGFELCLDQIESGCAGLKDYLSR